MFLILRYGKKTKKKTKKKKNKTDLNVNSILS